jgi:hypothetical protein
VDPRLGPKRFAADEAELRSVRVHLKLCPCPHCGRTGALIGHGWLRGYAEQAGVRVIRGRRVFCSNRFRRPGCGRTFSVLLGALLRGFVVRTETLFRFATEVTLGMTRKAAWHAATSGVMALSSGYRLWRRLGEAQSSLRARLCRQCPPPGCTHQEPVAGLLAHFRAAFAGADCAFSSFQLRLQRGLFD